MTGIFSIARQPSDCTSYRLSMSVVAIGDVGVEFAVADTLGRQRHANEGNCLSKIDEI